MNTRPALPAEAEIARLKAKMPLAFRQPLAVRRRRAVLWTAFAALFLWCLWDFGFTPQRIWAGLGRLGHVLGFMFPPHLWKNWGEISSVLKALGETLSMAFLGTVLGAVLAFPLAFLGARNFNRWPLGHFVTRRAFDVLRAVETLILALIFIRAFGLGPLAGVLAIAFGEIGVLGKLYAEAIENTSRKPVEGVIAAGGSRFQAFRFAVLPEVMPVLLSVTFYNFESNVRSSTILGIVGAGGIGFMLSDRIGAYRWDEVWSIIILIVVMVYVIDAFSARIRMWLIRGDGSSQDSGSTGRRGK
jgi:phosphonate transport system permease protein